MTDKDKQGSYDRFARGLFTFIDKPVTLFRGKSFMNNVLASGSGHPVHKITS